MASAHASSINLESSTGGTAGRTAARPARRVRRWTRPLAGIAAFVIVILLAMRAPAAARDFTSTFRRITWARLPWLGVAAVAELISLAFYAAAQGALLGAGRVRLRFRTLLGLTTAATSITMLVPAGAVPASGWLAAQYRSREAPMSLAVWTVLGGGFAAAVVVLMMLLVGAGIAGVASPVLLVSLGVFLVAGSTGFVVMVHHLDRVSSWLRPRFPGLADRLEGMLDVVRWRVSPARGTAVLACSTLNWIFDAVCLGAVFALIGLPVPWRAVLFAYAASQVAGSLMPLPGGLGAVEGGMVGALVATGTGAGHALAAAIVYRVVAYWGVALVGGVILLVTAHHVHAAHHDVVDARETNEREREVVVHDDPCPVPAR